MSDWADTEDHDYLNEWVGARIVEVTTGDDYEPHALPWLRLHFAGGRVVEIGSRSECDVGFTVQDVE